MKKEIGIGALVLLVFGASIILAHESGNEEFDENSGMNSEFDLNYMYDYHQQMHGDDLSFDEFEEMHESCPMHDEGTGHMMSMGGMMH